MTFLKKKKKQYLSYNSSCLRSQFVKNLTIFHLTKTKYNEKLNNKTDKNVKKKKKNSTQSLARLGKKIVKLLFLKLRRRLQTLFLSRYQRISNRLLPLFQLIGMRQWKMRTSSKKIIKTRFIFYLFLIFCENTYVC